MVKTAMKRPRSRHPDWYSNYIGQLSRVRHSAQAPAKFIYLFGTVYLA